MPGSRLEVFEGSGHFPHMDATYRFVSVLDDFLASTDPAQLDPETLRERILSGDAARLAA
jgi:hypothetical protein